MRVDVWSDVICPWCYIGKRKFEAAVAAFDGDVEVVWHPYQLDPRAPAEPTSVLDAYARKFGGPAEAVRIVEHLTAQAAAAGLDFHLEEAKRANTFDAHRLLGLALTEGRQNALKERLLQAYFTEGRNVADHSELAALAADVGLDREKVERFLASDDGVEATRAEIQEAYANGISAVPTFVFEGLWTVPGAQEAETFVRVLETVRERLEPKPDAAAAVCDDGSCEV
jgi:predicted DsbA family dithiol-disulfide isomerase